MEDELELPVLKEARAYSSHRNYSAALEIYTDILPTIDPQTIAYSCVLLEYAQCLIESVSYEAEVSYRRALQLRQHCEQGDPEEDLEIACDCLEACRANMEVVNDRVRLCEVHKGLGDIHCLANRFTEALKEYHSAYGYCDSPEASLEILECLAESQCDSKFHVDDFIALFEDETKYGFVIIDGHGTLFATLQGNVQTIIQNISVDLPKKHGRGGQSSVRFSRLRIEKRLAYIKKVAEMIANFFITNSMSNVEGIVLAGNADLKNELAPLIDARLHVVAAVDTNYGGKNGLNQAIELCGDVLKDVRFSKEKKILQAFLYELNLNTGKYCYGLQATIGCLESGAVETLIVWDSIEIEHEEQPFIDWIAEHYKDYGCRLVFVSNLTSEGTQFVQGFGGVGGILRYKMNMGDFDDLELSSFTDDEDIF